MGAVIPRVVAQVDQGRGLRIGQEGAGARLSWWDEELPGWAWTCASEELLRGAIAASQNARGMRMGWKEGWPLGMTSEQRTFVPEEGNEGIAQILTW